MSRIQQEIIEKDGVAVGVKITCSPPDMFTDIVDFHKKFGIHYSGPPRDLPTELRKLRTYRFFEEIHEIQNAMDNHDLVEQLDGYVDLIYIVLGTCHLHGWDFGEAWNRVHTANMKKELASETNPSKYGHSQDIVKPVGWVAPNLEDLI